MAEREGGSGDIRINVGEALRRRHEEDEKWKDMCAREDLRQRMLHIGDKKEEQSGDIRINVGEALRRRHEEDEEMEYMRWKMELRRRLGHAQE